MKSIYKKIYRIMYLVFNNIYIIKNQKWSMNNITIQIQTYFFGVFPERRRHEGKGAKKENSIH